MKIKELETNLRPREKALSYGLESLSDLEILALLLQSGSKNRSVFDLAKDVMCKCDNLEKLFDLRSGGFNGNKRNQTRKSIADFNGH